MHRHRKSIFLRKLKATKKHFHRKRHPRLKRKKSWHPFASLSMSLMVATGVVAHESILQANHLPPLRDFQIRALDETDMEVGQNLRLTAEGYYGTAPVVVKAVWNILGDRSKGYLVNCEDSQNCTFVATNPGTAVIEAQANHQFDHVNVEIRGPVTPLQNSFYDALPQWAERPILDLNKRNIIRGYDDGRFGSADTLTRGQLITLIYRMLTHLELIADPGNCRQYYDDVRPDHFAYDAACVFWQRGWSAGLRRLDVDEPTSRAQAAQFLYRILGIALLNNWNTTLGDILDGGELYPDIPTSHYVFYETAVLHRSGIMTGHPKGSFGPEEILNRAEAATVVHRALQKVQELRLHLF